MKIFIDFDSTLVDLIGGWKDWLKKEKRIKINSMDVSGWNYISDKFGEDCNRYWKTEGVYDNIKPIPGSIEFIQILKELYGTENIFIISTSARNMIMEKEKYAVKYFGIAPNYFLHEDIKWPRTSDGILVDDAPHNVIGHVLNNFKPAILFNYRNRYGWAKLDKPYELITICNDYGKCLEVINNNINVFPEEY